MKYFVDEKSIVREIWGKGDTILFIFAGASAEFALNKAVDWLYYTGKLPSDPLGRLFSTVSYARQIVFSNMETAYAAIDRISAIHSGLEAARGASIPDWAYRDVLFMLIDYSIRAYELIERPLSLAEKEEVFQVFYRLGSRMGVKDLPTHFEGWTLMREQHLRENMEKGSFTIDLYRQYKKHLGFMRYRLLIEAQVLIVPDIVKEFLGFRKLSLLMPVLGVYKLSRKVKADWLLKELILPAAYKDEIKALDQQAS